jgi:long-chain fatty acid transport protein
MNMQNRKIAWGCQFVRATLTAVAAIALIKTPALGEGFRNPPPGAFNLGRAGGRIAHIDDASAVQQNPANLAGLTNAQLEFTPTVVYIRADYESPLGSQATTVDPWKALPNAFGYLPLFDGKVIAGIGLTAPYGLSSEWEKDGSFADPFGLRYQAPWFTEMKTINANPTLAFKLSRKVSLGVGLDVMWSQLTFKQFYPWMIFPGSTGLEPDGNLKAKGDGFGVGGNIGLTWQIADRHRLSVTYRSPISIDYDGDFTIDNITPTAAFLGATSHSDFSTKVKFPTIVALGYGVQVTDNLRLEVDGEWLEFSNFDTLDLGVGNNAFLFPSTSIAENWKNTFTVGFGGDWQFAPDWVFRFGYQFYQSPVPDETLSTTIPDADQNVITVGIGYHHGRHSLELGYGLDFYDTRNITDNQNPAFNGTYDITVHLFSASYRLTF